MRWTWWSTGVAEWSAFWRELNRFDVTLFQWAGASFTVLSVIKLLVSVLALFWVADTARRWTARHLLHRLQVDEPTRETIGAVVRYVVLGVGAAIVLQNVGVKLTALSVVAGAVGVGVGFGLQNIFSNLISGLIIMFERPIKIGDRIEVGSVEGQVRDIGARRTMILTNDNITILVPNQRFILDNVTNLTHDRSPVRLRVPLNVAAGTDVRLVERLLLEAAQERIEVLGTPPPEVLIAQAGGGATSYELAVWYQPQTTTRQALTSALNFLILDRLRMHEVRTA